MNGIFSFVFVLSAAYFLIFAPEAFLSVLLEGGQKAATLCLSLLAAYSVWMGFLKVVEDCGLAKKVSALLRSPVKKLFRTQDERAIEYVCLNLSANMLGVSGAATPFGIRAAERLDLLPFARYNQSMLFVLAATGVQILPTTALALFISYGAQNAYAIIVPSLLSTAISTVLGVAAVRIFLGRKEKTP